MIGASDRRTLARGIIICVVIAIGGRGTPVWRSWREDVRNRGAASAERLARAQAILAERAQLRWSHDAASQQVAAADSLMLDGVSAADGAAQLATIVAEIADSAGVRVTALQIRADTSRREQLSRASVRITGTTDIGGLTSMLDNIETGAPLMIVREISVQGEPLATSDRPEQLRIDMVVEALTRITTSRIVRTTKAQ